MNIKITAIEGNIDKEYSDNDIQEITKEGIKLPECFIDFEECVLNFRYSRERREGNRMYVGARNCLTNPPYMKFWVDGKDIFILFSSKDSYYSYANKIRECGYETFDLS